MFFVTLSYIKYALLFTTFHVPERLGRIRHCKKYYIFMTYRNDYSTDIRKCMLLIFSWRISTFTRRRCHRKNLHIIWGLHTHITSKAFPKLSDNNHSPTEIDSKIIFLLFCAAKAEPPEISLVFSVDPLGESTQGAVFVCPWVHASSLTNLVIKSGSGRDIFLKSFDDISGMFQHLFQIILNFLYVCQSISWLTSLLKIDKYRDISGSGWDISLKSFGDIPGMSLQGFQILPNFLYVSQPVSWLTSLLKLDKNKDISSSWWDIFLKFFGDIPGMLVD